MSQALKAEQELEAEPYFVRPSSSKIARICGHAPRLSRLHPEGNANTAFGESVDLEITDALVNGSEPESPEARRAVAWFRETFVGARAVRVQKPLVLNDPETGAFITKGTTDVEVVLADGGVAIIDWKKIGQFWAGHIGDPDDHDQTLIYGVSAALEHGAPYFRTFLAFFDADRVLSKASRGPAGDGFYRPADWWAIIDGAKQANATKDQAILGPHCGRCYQRRHCTAWMLPVHQGPSALGQLGAGTAITTPEQALAALRVLLHFDDAVKEASKIAWGMLDAWVAENGPIRDGDEEYGYFEKKGKRSGASVAELEAAGLTDLIKEPKTTFDYGFRKIPSASPARARRRKQQLQIVPPESDRGGDAEQPAEQPADGAA